MIDAVVYIGHGSRLAEGNTQFITFIESIMKELSYKKQVVSFLEIAFPTIDETVEKVVSEGARRILIVPVLLFAATHHKQDIPKALEAIQNRHPHVTFVMTEPFGVHPNMVKLVVKRVEEVLTERDAAVLLVGRGSSDPEPIGKLQKIGQAAERMLKMPVYEAFLTAGVPSMDIALANLQNEYKKIYVMPYLLFTGLLLKKIERYIASCEQEIILCQNLEFDELMKQTLIERIKEQVQYSQKKLNNN
jgi:sirohydrochlorin ferrochelatase